jgi:hypothetical protein
LSYQYVCDACRQAFGLRAQRSYLSRIRREAGGFSNSGIPSKPRVEVVSRDPSGKPLLVGIQQEDVFVTTPTGCDCACAANGHNPLQCTGEEKFKIGGRPGSGAVDQLAEEFGREPTPELAVAPQETCQAMVTHFLAWWFGSSNEERIKLESNDLARMRYQDQIKLLRDILQEERPQLMRESPYCNLIASLRKLAKFRDKIAHSWPAEGDFFTRIRRVKAENVIICITPEELAEYLDLSTALQSQLGFLVRYWDRA